MIVQPLIPLADVDEFVPKPVASVLGHRLVDRPSQPFRIVVGQSLVVEEQNASVIDFSV
jgi:hypothetical protein